MERRLAAILAADVVGYSRLMGADEAGTLALLNTFENDVIEPTVAGHSGRIVKRMGDGYLVEFQSVVSAVQCALDWQTETSGPLFFRIGINLGDVIVQKDDLFGDGVNIATRLETLAESGGICLSEDAWRQARGKVAAQFEDLGDKKLKNITEPVRVFCVALDARPEPVNQEEAPSALSRPGILLAPFRHLGTGTDAEALAAGLTETLAAALAHFEEFELIDPRSAGTAVAASDALEAGRRLGARYILEGTVQIALQKARIGVQLVDTASGQRVWSETLDRDLEDVFGLQDDITAFVASTMSDAVGEEQAKVIEHKPVSELTLDELMMRGIQHLHRADNREDIEVARAIFEQVRQAVPKALFPTLCLCWTHALELRGGWEPSRPDALEYSLNLMQDLLHRYPRSAHAHRLMSRLLFFKPDHEHGLAHAVRAYELNPYHSDMMIELGVALTRNGQAQEAITQFKRAFATNPYSPAGFKVHLSLANFLTGRYQDGLDVLSSYERGASVATIYRVLNLVGLERVEEAKEEARALLAGGARFALHSLRPLSSFKRAEDRERISVTLRKAGLQD